MIRPIAITTVMATLIFAGSPAAQTTTQPSRPSEARAVVHARLCDLDKVKPGQWIKSRSFGNFDVPLRIGRGGGGSGAKPGDRGFWWQARFDLINADHPMKVKIQFDFEEGGAQCKIEQAVDISYDAREDLCLRSDDGRFLLLLDWSPAPARLIDDAPYHDKRAGS